MKHLPTSLHPTGKPPRKPWSVERQVHSYRNFRDAERIDLIWDPAPGRQAGALGDGIDVGVPVTPQILYRQKAREGTCGGRGAELKYRAMHVCKSRRNYGTSGGWGSEGLVNVVGNAVGTRGR